MHFSRASVHGFKMMLQFQGKRCCEHFLATSVTKPEQCRCSEHEWGSKVPCVYERVCECGYACMWVCMWIYKKRRGRHRQKPENSPFSLFASDKLTYIFTANLITDCVLYLKLYFKCDLKRNLLETMIFSSKNKLFLWQLVLQENGLTFLSVLGLMITWQEMQVFSISAFYVNLSVWSFHSAVIFFQLFLSDLFSLIKGCIFFFIFMVPPELLKSCQSNFVTVPFYKEREY